MSRRGWIWLLLAWVVSPLWMTVDADVLRNPRREEVKQVRWTHKTNNPRGLYSVYNPSVANGLALTVNALYYYGDIDMLDYAFKYGWQPQNLSLGGSLIFGYLHPLGTQCNWRFTLAGGYMHGNDSARYDMNSDGQLVRGGKGVFRNGFAEAAVGVEWYPFPTAGFYLYAGFGLNLSYINYDFFKYNIPPGKTYGIVPIIPLEIGYNFQLHGGWFLSIEASVHQALTDFPGASIDAWPLYKSTRAQWPDGYFQVGISVSYRWQNCPECLLYDPTQKHAKRKSTNTPRVR